MGFDKASKWVKIKENIVVNGELAYGYKVTGECWYLNQVLKCER